MNRSSLPPGSTFNGRYTVVRALRSGSQGSIYEVIDPTSRRRALKVMHWSLLSDPCQRERFRLEATVTAGIHSDHLVEVLDAGVAASGRPFIVMELLEGEELHDLVKRRGPLPAAEVLVYLAQAAVAIEKAHAAGVIHRDLKPGNLFLTYADDGSPRLKVIDFGLAKAASSNRSLELTGAESLGTPLYMAPEQIRDSGRVGPAADLYALAHVAYTLLVGTSYWTDESEAEGIWSILLKASKGATEPASPRAALRGVALPPGFDAWFARATALAPEDRFDRPSTMIAALAGVFAAPCVRAPESAPRSTDARHAPETPRRRGAVVAGVLAGIGVAALSALGGWFVMATATENAASAEMRDVLPVSAVVTCAQRNGSPVY